MPTAHLIARFRLLTPAFLGDAFQRPRLRAPGIKGALRFWYRAVDPAFRDNEPNYFGGQGGGQGQSPWLLSLEGGGGRPYEWQARTPGLRYLGYPFDLGRSEPRKGLPAGRTFAVHCLLPRAGSNTGLRQALVASLWCLGHFGSLGSRARRGFGALALESWEAVQGEWPELAELPLLVGLDSEERPERVQATIEQALETFRGWFGEFSDSPPNPHLGPAMRMWLTQGGHKPHDWEGLLESMGKTLQGFRSRRRPDYDDVKDYLQGQRLHHAPQRATFGLPLTFRYRSLQGRSVTFVPVDSQTRKKFERQGSLLWLRPLQVGERMRAFYLRLDGAVPGHSLPAGDRQRGGPLEPPEINAMDEFLDHLQRRKA